MTVGERVVFERTRQGLSQAQLAERACIDVGGLSRLENGITKRPQKRTMAMLSEALGVELGEPDQEEKRKPQLRRDYTPRFAFCRKATGHSRVDAAKALGIRTETLAGYETCTNYPSAWMVLKMARLYGVTCGYLLGEKEDKYRGRFCTISYCKAGLLHDRCCHDCPDREGCEDACENSPEKCNMARKKRPNEMFG
jgi:transcriptional regulator with XRE-family HTH domain